MRREVGTQRETSMRRQAVERAIGDEERTLAEAIALLRERAPWDHWPTHVRRALEVALDEPTTAGTLGTSAWQARVLRRHLFGPDTWSSPFPIPARPRWIETRRAERLRADLPALVPLRAGRYLVSQEDGSPRR